MQSFVARRGDFSLLAFDIMNPGPLKDRIVQLSEQIGATKSDFERFRARGGKIIWVQGNDDPSVSPFVNASLYKSVVAKIGTEQVDGFMRFYLIPGLAHGGGKFSPTWDNLTALDNWVENGVPRLLLSPSMRRRRRPRGGRAHSASIPRGPSTRNPGTSTAHPAFPAPQSKDHDADDVRSLPEPLVCMGENSTCARASGEASPPDCLSDILTGRCCDIG